MSHICAKILQPLLTICTDLPLPGSQSRQNCCMTRILVVHWSKGFCFVASFESANIFVPQLLWSHHMHSKYWRNDTYGWARAGLSQSTTIHWHISPCTEQYTSVEKFEIQFLNEFNCRMVTDWLNLILLYSTFCVLSSGLSAQWNFLLCCVEVILIVPVEETNKVANYFRSE